jgi:hypothetical protein
LLHFSTWAPSLVSYFKTGAGPAIPGQLKTQVEKLPVYGNTATLLTCVNASTADEGDYAPTARPFGCSASNEWNVGEGGYWSVDEHNPSSTYATLHQVWVRPSVYWRHAHTLNTSVVLPGSRLAVMSDPALVTKYEGNITVAPDTFHPFVLPFTFNFFSVNYGNTGGLSLGDNGYITIGYNSTVTSITNASFPGAGLFLGAANRSLLFYGLTTEQNPTNGLKYATAVIRYYSSPTGVDEDEVNLEVTFAKNSVNQFIEIRAGSIRYGTTGNGTWGLSDGYQFLVNSTVMPALASGQSMVLQSDLEGRYWVPHVNSSLAIRAPPAPSTGEGTAECLRALPSPIPYPRAAAVLLQPGWVPFRC